MDPKTVPRGVLLVVDDDSSFRNLVVTLCDERGYEVEEAESATDALARTRTRGYDVILLDLFLPDHDAFYVIDALRADEKTAVTPVILVTGPPSEQVASRAARYGPIDFLWRPFAPEDLFARITAATIARDTTADALRVLRLERQLRESEKRLGVIFERSPDAIFVTTSDGIIVDANPAAERALARTRETLWSETLITFSPARQPDGRTTAELFEELSRTGHAGEWCARRPDGSLVHFEAVVQAIPLAGIEDARIVSARDVTRQRSLEVALHQAQRFEAIGLLAGGVAHDFNNLLTVILGFIELALSHAGPDPIHGERRLQLQEARKAGERASEITRQLLTLGRQKPLQTRGSVSLDAVLERCAPLLRTIVREDVKISLRLGAKETRILGEASRLEQIVMNLTANARDAMPKGGTLLIETVVRELEGEEARAIEAPSGRYVLLRIADNGTGMTDTVKMRLFEPFFTTKPPEKGTGLGLAVVFAIVQEHEGRILVESLPGEGTVFSIYFPTSTASANESPTPGNLRRGSETVLVVEDDGNVRDVEVTMLETLGYRPIPCSSAAEAVAVFQERGHEIKLVLSDVVMPDENGIELEQRLRAIDPELKIILVSGYPRSDLTGPTVAWIQKPVTIHELSARVREVLDRPSDRDSVR
jgi:PAS domain S-box-containing protein